MGSLGSLSYYLATMQIPTSMTPLDGRLCMALSRKAKKRLLNCYLHIRPICMSVGKKHGLHYIELLIMVTKTL